MILDIKPILTLDDDKGGDEKHEESKGESADKSYFKSKKNRGDMRVLYVVKGGESVKANEPD